VLRGKSLDLVPFEDPSTPPTISHFPAINLTLDLETMYLSEAGELKQVKGHIFCSKKRCDSASLAAGFAGGGDMSMAIYREGGKRLFSLESNHAGQVMKHFDITDRMQNGGMQIKGEYDDSKEGNPLDGTFFIKDFTLKDAPVLGRILNASSLTGLVETLSGKGITFDVMDGHFVFAEDVLNIKEARAKGASLGISSDGTVDIAKSAINLHGNLAPAYAINSFVGKIPLVGEMLVGGEGQGVIAFNFSVKGNTDDPDVVVNPLSALTPGFMRKFFDIFKDKPSAAPSAPTKPAATGNPTKL